MKRIDYRCDKCGEDGLATRDTTLYWDADEQKWLVSEDTMSPEIYCCNCGDHLEERDPDEAPDPESVNAVLSTLPALDLRGRRYAVHIENNLVTIRMGVWSAKKLAEHLKAMFWHDRGTRQHVATEINDMITHALSKAEKDRA